MDRPSPSSSSSVPASGLGIREQDVEALQRELTQVEKMLGDRSGTGSDKSEPRDFVASAHSSQHSAGGSRPHSRLGSDDDEHRNGSSQSSSDKEGSCNWSVRRQPISEPFQETGFLMKLMMDSLGNSSGGSSSGTKEYSRSGDGAESTGSGSHTSDARRSNIGSGVNNTIFQSMTMTQRDFVSKMEAHIHAVHGEELEKVRQMLTDSYSDAANAKENRTELLNEIARLSALFKGQEDLQEQLEVSQSATRTMEENRDNLSDTMAGMEARHKNRIERLLAEMASAKERNVEKDESRTKERDREKEECKAMKKQIREARKMFKASRNEVEVLQRDEEIARKKEKSDKMDITEQLDAAHREIKRRQEAERARDCGIPVSPADDYAESKTLERMLLESRLASNTSNNELYELRLEMARLKQDHQDQLLNLSSKLDAASDEKGTLKAFGPPGGRGARIGRPTKAPLNLPSIDEGVDDDLSSIGDRSEISGQVSSCGEDVDDMLEDDGFAPAGSCLSSAESRRLRQELHEAELSITAARDSRIQAVDDTAAADAVSKSKIDRLHEQVKELRLERRMDKDDLANLQMRKTCDNDESAQTIADLHKQLQASWDNRTEDQEQHQLHITQQQTEHQFSIDEMREQLQYALESKRILSMRLEDATREMEMTRTRHAVDIDDLQKRMKLLKATAAGRHTHNNDSDASSASGTDDEDVAQDLMQQLRSMEEERNLLRNNLEWKDVDWQGKMDDMKRQQQGLQQQHEADQSKLSQMEAQFQQEKLAKVELERAHRDAELRHEEEMFQMRQKVAELTAVSGGSIASWLRCPSRHREDAVASCETTSQAVPAPPPASSVSCQTVTWRVVNSISGVNVLMCDKTQLDIKEASKMAFTTWGSSALRNGTFQSLLNQSALGDSAARVTKKLVDGGDDSFSLVNIGCLEFWNRQGQTFDAMVTCAQLPAETGSPSSVLVIIEAMSA